MSLLQLESLKLHSKVLAFGILICLVLIESCSGMAHYCYQCDSGQSGCGTDIDIRVQHWHTCDISKVPTPFCVKYTQKIGGQVYVTRGCLSDFLMSTRHRINMPMVRRHGYCVNSIPFEQLILEKGRSNVGNEYQIYCFCNDWNGCNSAPSTRRLLSGAGLALTALITMIIGRMC